MTRNIIRKERLVFICTKVKMSDIKKGDKFFITESDGKVVVMEDGKIYFTATEDAQPSMYNEDYYQPYCVRIK